MEKCLAMTFGRTVFMPDFDIDADYPSEDCQKKWPLCMAYIYLAKIQSRLYEQLYSASANALGDDDRHLAALDLDQQLCEWSTTHMKIVDKSQPQHFDGKYLELEIKFNFYNSLVLVHRADHGGGPESEKKCLVAAREAIRTIKNSVLQHPDLAESGLVAWLVMPGTHLCFDFADVLQALSVLPIHAFLCHIYIYHPQSSPPFNQGRS